MYRILVVEDEENIRELICLNLENSGFEVLEAKDGQEAVERVGHSVGGVCPFAVKEGVEVCLDESLRRFETVLPAAGSANSAIELTIPELERCSNSLDWVDVCKDRQ